MPGAQTVKPPLSIRVRYRLSGLIWTRLHFLLPDRYVRARGRGGAIYLNLRESQMMVRRALGVYEYWAMGLAGKLLQPGMTAVDVGANKGDYSLLFARTVGPTGRVLSFEPVEENCGWLRRSVAANGYGWIEVEQLALSASDGTASFHPGRASGWGSLVAGRPGGAAAAAVEVPTARLDRVLAERGIDTVDLLKVDVEGAELQVLQGATDLLARSTGLRLIVAIDTSSDDERTQIFELLTGSGYTLYAIGPGLTPLDRLDASTETVLAERR